MISRRYPFALTDCSAFLSIGLFEYPHNQFVLKAARKRKRMRETKYKIWLLTIAVAERLAVKERENLRYG